jgi:methyl-accepting chemotaxis protein
MGLVKMTLARKLGAGFGVVLLLLALAAALAYVGIDGIVKNAKEVIAGNQLDGELAQKEVDHLNWASQVSAFLNDSKVKELKVQMDPKKCGFGKWYYSDARLQAEIRVPALKGPLAAIEEPHATLHNSAAEIKKLFRQTHPGLLVKLNNILIKHLEWAETVSSKLAVEATQGSLGGEPFQLGVITDPTKCALGVFLQMPETKQLMSEIPELAKALAELDEPHKQLHASALQIESLMNEGNPKGAVRLFQEQAVKALEEVQGQLDKAIAAEEGLEKSAREAALVYVDQTQPSLAKVRELLHQVRGIARENILSQDAMLSQAESTQLNVSVVGAVALVVGLFLAVFIGRSVSRTLRIIAQEMDMGSAQVSAASNQVSTASQQLAEGSTEHAANLEEVCASLEEVSSMTKSNAANASEADGLMAQTRDVVTQAAQSMDNLSQAMNGLSASGDQMAKIIKTIDEIAFQTNLLALNAAVEAARAGDAGSGFAVVADEVRNLAMRAAEAAKNTANLLESTINKTKQGSELVSRTNAAFLAVAENSDKVGGLISEIAAASSEQAQGINQVNIATTEMDKVTQNNAANAEESAAAAEEMAAQAETMKGFVNDLASMVGRGEPGNEKPKKKLKPGSKDGGRRGGFLQLPAGVKKALTSHGGREDLSDEDSFKDF